MFMYILIEYWSLFYLSKVFEKSMSTQILKYIESNNLLFTHQFGFRNNHSTCEAVLKFIQNCLGGKESSLNVGAKFYSL